MTTSVITMFVNTNICQDAYVFYWLLALQWNAEIADARFLIVDVSVDVFKQYPNSTLKTIYTIYMTQHFFATRL